MKPKDLWIYTALGVCATNIMLNPDTYELLIIQCVAIIAFYLSYIVEILKGEDK